MKTTKTPVITQKKLLHIIVTIQVLSLMFSLSLTSLYHCFSFFSLLLYNCLLLPV